MRTTDNKNRTIRENRDSRNPNFNSPRTGQINDHFDDIDNVKESDNDNREIAERGYTVRNGYNPNRPNPDQEDSSYDAEVDDLNDDFHNDRDLDDTDDVYEVELEREELDDEDLLDEELDEDEEDEIDELDNPSDAREDEDFNETEDVLEDIDDEEEDDYQYIEDDVQEDDDEDELPDTDPRRL